MKKSSLQHEIIIYNSNKTALSCTTIDPKLTVILKEDVYVSFYDNTQNYWSLHATDKEINQLVQLLKKFNVTIRNSSLEDSCPPQPEITLISDNETNANEIIRENDYESSSTEKKAKASILNRMINVGRSVLPSQNIQIEKSSDSSDTNTENIESSIRHKSNKYFSRRNQDKHTTEGDILTKEKALKYIPKLEDFRDDSSSYTKVCEKLLPLNSGMAPMLNCTHDNNMDSFITEQRLINTELRFNINKMSVELEKILDKIQHGNHTNKNNTTDLQTELFQKLLLEYECKLGAYERLMKLKGIDDKNILELVATRSFKSTQSDNLEKNTKISELEQIIQEKDMQFLKLEGEFKQLRTDYNSIVSAKGLVDPLQKRIEVLEQELAMKNEELIHCTKNISKEKNTNDISKDVSNKLKKIMNDTFQAISANFDDDASYSGDRVKNTIAVILKQITTESLNDL